jgi:hypothetical protein
MQDEISKLEKALDMQDETSKLEKALDACDEAAEYPNNLQRADILSQIRDKLVTYDEVLMKARELSAFQRPSHRDYTSLRNWFAKSTDSENIRRRSPAKPFRLRENRANRLPITHTSLRIPSILGEDLHVDALGDTGAKYSFMSDEYATQMERFKIDRSSNKLVKIGSGEMVTTTGTVRTLFRFRGESEAHSVLFHLLPKCKHKLILGNSFLKKTETFTNAVKYACRVVKRAVAGIQGHDFFYVGGSGPMFRGLINGRQQNALADTGAKVLIMDEAYAQWLGLHIATGQQHRTRVQFADGSTAWTSGMVYGVSWQFGDDAVCEQHMLDFHVLKNAPANVILSEDFLLGDDTNAFAEYDCYLVDDEDDEDDASCFVIDIDTSYVNEAVDSREYRDGFELIRRGHEDDWIDSLPFDQKIDARVAVEARRAQWDPTQPMTGGNAANVVPPRFSGAKTESKPLLKRLRLRLKLKKKTT